MLSQNAVVISKDDIAGAPVTVRKWFADFFFGVKGEATKSAAGSKASASKKEDKSEPDPREMLMTVAKEMIDDAAKKPLLKMALKSMKLAKASECPDDKISELLALLSAD